MKNETKQSLKWGGLSGLLAASCCTIPLLLLILGLSAVTAGGLNSYLIGIRWFVLIPIGLIIAGTGIYLKTKKEYGTCNIENLKRNKVFALTTIIVMFIIWGILVYALVPIIWGLAS